jgi:ParB family transcriptional regulator, chromosome partitioning protein
VGERRLLASKKAGKETIPAFLRQVSDEQAMEITIVENLQRTDLNPIEQARAYDRLGREFKLTQEQMAQRTGKDRASVANFLRLLRLPVEVQAKVEGGELSFGHARALLPLEDPESILKAAQKVMALSMSVRQTESYVQNLVNPEKRKAAEEKVKEPLDPNVREARDLLQRALGLKVTIEDRKGKGRVIIEYSSLSDFDELLETVESMRRA